METVFIILFVLTLLYAGMADRMKTLVNILGVQGLLLFATAYVALHSVDVLNLSFILVETILVKGLLIPLMLLRTIRKNGIVRETNPTVTHFQSLLVVTVIIVLSFILASNIHQEHLRVGYFTASVSAVFVGLFIVMTRVKIITHMIGYLILENGIFLLSLAVGNEMPLAVNTAILLDLLTSVLLLAFLVDKVGETFQTVDVHDLNELND
ncbi:MAG: hypothetical protein IPH85_13120 [Ignavibacteria bacterium]|nr:hypothetical protein [Ignavibacteria bacterium]MBP7093806.1 hypothetical protein [Candidatus Kapabacteria bacterium]MBK6418871.1 hypothetical protein [Ignavibacteria bacterium]MBK6760435.1 hypothetical protein [Ignavibacteria bacterium]MBK7186835.1 hypothetical protein [Ignavibacteria bacterium]